MANISASSELTRANRSRYACKTSASPSQIDNRSKALLNLSVSRKVRISIGVFSPEEPRALFLPPHRDVFRMMAQEPDYDWIILKKTLLRNCEQTRPYFAPRIDRKAI